MGVKIMTKRFSRRGIESICIFVMGFLLCFTQSTLAITFDITIDGSDAIFLAGRTDLTIPQASDPWPGGMIRHDNPTPEEIQETLPPIISVSPGNVIQVLDPAIGGISFYNDFGAPIFGPDGDAGGFTNLSSFGGISGFYSDGQGPLNQTPGDPARCSTASPSPSLSSSGRVASPPALAMTRRRRRSRPSRRRAPTAPARPNR